MFQLQTIGYRTSSSNDQDNDKKRTNRVKAVNSREHMQSKPLDSDS